MRRLIKKLITTYLNKRGIYLVGRAKWEDNRRLKAEGVPGWLTKEECRRLYCLGLITTGAILEIGHFLGKSTACLCEAIHDSKKSRLFYSYDLGFTSVKEFKQFYDKVHRADVSVPTMWQDLVWSKNMTTTQVASKNLEQIGLDSYVKLISGNYIDLDSRKYDLIFCDALHEPNEIQLNLPHIVEHSANSCIWVFHDMNEKNIDFVVLMSNALLIELTGLLGVFLYVRAGTKA